MRGFTLLLATALTFGYGFAAQAAMKAERAGVIRRLGAPTTPAPILDATRVWYGGTLEPVTVEAPAHEKCAVLS